MQYDFFYRAQNKDTAKMFSADNEREISIDADTTDLAELINLAVEAGMSKGTYQSGCYQIQGPDGIWFGKNDRKINPANKGSYTFVKWEDLE